jgi:hypothetical protein
MVSENDKLVKRSKEERLKGEKRSAIEEVFGGYYLNTGESFLLLITFIHSSLLGLHASVSHPGPHSGPVRDHILQKC